MYKDSFEWRFEFPNILNNSGDFEGFDIIIGNPPYIKEATNKAAFDGVKDSEYYQGKMDLWYLFACDFLDKLKKNTGILTFIATNNWVTNAGASKLRNKIVEDGQIVSLIDFTNFKIFENAAIQTMIMIFKRNNLLPEYQFDYRKIVDTDVQIEDVNNILNRIPSPNFNYLTPVFNREKFKDKSFVFSSDSIEEILELINEKSDFRIDGDNEIMSGIDVLQDFIGKESANKLNNQYKVGSGVFVLTQEEIDQLNFTSTELNLLKPYYTTENLQKYYGNKKNKYWIIYTDSSFRKESKISMYPNIRKHLDQFKSILTSDNKPYGLHRARVEDFFRGEKILSLRKSAIPSFTFTDFDCYISRAFIVIKSERINQKYLTALLNSKLIAFWLNHKGKMQGFQYQIDKGPLVDLPLINTKDSNIFETLVDYIIFLKENVKLQVNDYVNNDHIVQTFEDVINACVYELYFGEHMRDKGIDVLKFARDLIKPINFIEKKNENADMINGIYSKLKEPGNEIRNRMMFFATRSENIILPIQKIY